MHLAVRKWMDTIYMRTKLDKKTENGQIWDNLQVRKVCKCHWFLVLIFPILICCFLGRGECRERGGSSIIILRLVSGYSVTSDTILYTSQPRYLQSWILVITLLHPSFQQTKYLQIKCKTVLTCCKNLTPSSWESRGQTGRKLLCLHHYQVEVFQ